MVERIFDGILPFYIVFIPTPSSPSTFEGSVINTNLKSNDVHISSTPSTMTFLPVNFWLFPMSHEQELSFRGVDGLVNSTMRNKDECIPRSLLVQLDRGKSDGQRWLSLYITDPTDLLFYYEQKLDEEAYGKMRAEQQILVPFESFTEQLAAFLKAVSGCIKNFGSKLTTTTSIIPNTQPIISNMPPRMAVCLAITPLNWAIFQIVETSSFKHIAHLSLRVDRLSDEGMKRRLASLAFSAQTELATLKSRLSETRRDADSFAQSITAERDALKATLDNLTDSIQTLQRSTGDETPKHINESDKHRHAEKNNIQDSDERRGESSSFPQRILAPIVDRISELREWAKERDNLAVRVSQLEMKLMEKGEENNALKSTNSKLKDDQSRMDSLRNELARKRVLLEDMERAAGEREERITMLKSELRIARDGKNAIEEESATIKQKISQFEHENESKSNEIIRLNEMLASIQAELRAAKGKARAKSAIVNAKDQELESVLSSLGEEKANVTVLTNALHELQERYSLVVKENQNLLDKIDRNDRVSEWMSRRIGGESEYILPPPSHSSLNIQMQPKTTNSKSNTIAGLHAMITNLGLNTPGGPLSTAASSSSSFPVASSFSPVEPGDLPTPPQPTGLGRI